MVTTGGRGVDISDPATRVQPIIATGNVEFRRQTGDPDWLHHKYTTAPARKPRGPPVMAEMPASSTHYYRTGAPTTPRQSRIYKGFCSHSEAAWFLSTHSSWWNPEGLHTAPGRHRHAARTPATGGQADTVAQKKSVQTDHRCLAGAGVGASRRQEPDPRPPPPPGSKIMPQWRKMAIPAPHPLPTAERPTRALSTDQRLRSPCAQAAVFTMIIHGGQGGSKPKGTVKRR
jgi:hypothetical protein